MEVTPLDVATLGDATAARRLRGMLGIGPGVQITVYTDFIAVFDGPAMIRLAFVNGGPGGTGVPFPDVLQRSLAETVVTRAGA